MYQNKINFTPNDILEKDFKIDTRGYRLKEVDQFLDSIIEDYNTFIDNIKKRDAEIDELTTEILKLKQELRNASVNVEIAKASNTAAVPSNLDVLKRLSNLEQIVFGNNSNSENNN